MQDADFAIPNNIITVTSNRCRKVQQRRSSNEIEPKAYKDAPGSRYNYGPCETLEHSTTARWIRQGVDFEEGGNQSARRKPSKSGWDRLKLNPHTTFAVEVEGMIDVHYASLTSCQAFLLMPVAGCLFMSCYPVLWKYKFVSTLQLKTTMCYSCTFINNLLLLVWKLGKLSNKLRVNVFL